MLTREDRSCNLLPRLFALSTLVGLAGCGAQAYEQRLGETARYFEFRERQDQLLAQEWSGPGVKFRAPKIFTMMPAPPPQFIQDEQGNLVSNPEFQGDSRQPTYENIRLPNLVAAWTGTVDAASGDTTKQLPCYMYLCSNREIWLEDNPVERATQFHQTVSESVTGPLGIYLQEHDWQSEKHPRSNGYVTPKNYTMTMKVPERPIHGEPYAISLYLHQIQDIQVVLVIVMPQNVDPRVKFDESLGLALQTLEVSGEIPRQGAAADPSNESSPSF